MIKENLIEIFTLLGIISLSVGGFLYSTIVGFIVTGILFLGLAIAVFTTEGGD